MIRGSTVGFLFLVIPCVGACGPGEEAAGTSAGGAEPASDPTGAPNSLTAAELAEGWQLLFDGQSLDGWRGLGRDAVPAGHWVVEDGAIRKVASGGVPTAADGQPLEGGDIQTLGTYRDFELSFEWKVAAGANSGIKYNVSEALSATVDPVHAALGFEYQVLDDDLHPDAANGPNRTAGALYDMIGPGSGKALNPVGEFNRGRIVFDDGHGEHWLNGHKVLEFDLGTPRFDSLLAVSKYDPIPGFADLRAGHVVLQDHGDDVWYRNLKIKDLSPPEQQP
jgi:hypothetical protein